MKYLFIFDCDGVIREISIPLIYQTYIIIGHYFKMSFEEICPDYEAFVQWFDNDWRYNLNRMGIVTAQDHVRAGEVFHKTYDHKITTFPWLEEIFSSLSVYGHIAILSNSSTKSISASLNGVQKYVTCALGYDRVLQLKPAPDGILQIMNEVGAHTHNTIMIGDTSADVCAGKNAGVRTAAVAWGATETMEALCTLNADIILCEPGDLLNL